MKIERTKNASRNIVFGSVLKIIQIVVPFLLRTAMTYFIGIQYLGLNSLFTSILQVLNLTELGVGSAMVYSMYKPIAEDDSKSICALMQMYRLYYRVIGLIVLVFGLILLPFLPYLIKDEIPSDINVYILYLLNLASTVLSYWLFAYKNSLLQAHQRIDISSKVMLFTNLLQYLFQFLVLWLFRNYYLYVIVMLVTQTLTNIITAIVVSKLFPDYKPQGRLKKTEIKKINQRIKDLFTSKIGAVVVTSADTIVISAFLGLTVLAVYQNYYYVLTAIISIVAVFFNACVAGIGNSLIVETKEKNYNDLRKFTFVIAWLSAVCSSCFLCMFQPFMELWMGKENMLPFSAVMCLVIYYYIFEINQLLNTYKDAGGIWRSDRFRPLVTAVTNLGLNLIMVQFLGIYGVLLSTVLSMILVGMPWLFHNLFTELFEKKYLKSYLFSLFGYLVVTIIACAFCYGLCYIVTLPLILHLIVDFLICFVLCNLLYILFFHKKKEFKETILLIDRITHYKFHLAMLFTKERDNS